MSGEDRGLCVAGSDTDSRFEKAHAGKRVATAALALIAHRGDIIHTADVGPVPGVRCSLALDSERVQRLGIGGSRVDLHAHGLSIVDENRVAVGSTSPRDLAGNGVTTSTLLELIMNDRHEEKKTRAP